MVIKEVNVCDLCKEIIANGKCDLCDRDICKKHSKECRISLGFGLITKISICDECYGHIEYSKVINNNQELKKILIEFIKKQMIMDKLK